MKTLLIILTITMGLVFFGCTDYKAKITSTTNWSGSFGGTTVDGSGNQTIDLPDDEIVCIVVQKETEHGILSAEIIDEGFLSFGGGEKKTTTAKYGVVSVCSQ